MKKLNLKELPLKQFLLDKGERVGLYVAAGLMALMLFFGLTGWLTSSAYTNAKALIDTIQAKKSLISSSTPSADVADRMKSLDKKLTDPVQHTPTDPALYAVMEPNFTPGPVPMDKRLGP